MSTRTETVTIATFDMADFCGCEGVDCGPCCSVQTDCCVEEIPQTLYFTLSSCACPSGGSGTLTYDSGTGTWTGSASAGETGCEGDFSMTLRCSGSPCAFEADFDLGGCTSTTGVGAIACSCGPLSLTFVDSFASCCGGMGGDLTITITE